MHIELDTPIQSLGLSKETENILLGCMKYTFEDVMLMKTCCLPNNYFSNEISKEIKAFQECHNSLFSALVDNARLRSEKKKLEDKVRTHYIEFFAEKMSYRLAENRYKDFAQACKKYADEMIKAIRS